ncbi:MAG: hypothetical protein ACT4OQ_05095 [Chloroflexota bacterium]
MTAGRTLTETRAYNDTSLIHGHAPPAVTEAASRRLARGASFPLPTPEEIGLAAPTGLGCLSTGMGEAEVEYFLQVLNAGIR